MSYRLDSEKENSLWNACIFSGKFYDLHSSPNIIQVINSRRMRQVGHVACIGDRRGLYRILEERPERNRSLVRHRHRWEDIIIIIIIIIITTTTTTTIIIIIIIIIDL